MKKFSPEFLAFMALVNRGDYLILDTETTGLNDGEICQIAIIDQTGRTVLDTLVKPMRGIPADATRIHGITNDDVRNAPSWQLVREHVIAELNNRTCIIYNAVYDRKMMHKSDEAIAQPHYDYKQYTAFDCAMLAYSEFAGEWNDYHGNYRWQRLSVAALNCDVQVKDAHNALGDCLMTRGVIRYMQEHYLATGRMPDYDYQAD